MVRGQLISPKELLKCTPYQRTEMLADKVGITEEELRLIWALPLEERVISAAVLLYEKTGRSESITSRNVPAIIYGDWKGQYHTLKGGHLIAELMKPKKDGIDSNISKRHRITYIQLLRDSVIGSKYIEEMTDASKEWDKFRLSKSDWQRSVMIPDQITPDSALLAGVEWGDGSVSDYPYAFRLCGNADDFAFYSEEVSPLLKKVHDLEVPIEAIKSQTVANGKSFSSMHPWLQIGSMGITTWLVDDLGFPNTPNKTNVNLPRVNLNYENKAEFLYGIVGSMGILSNDNRIKLSDKDETFIKNLKELSQSMEYTPFQDYSSQTLGTSTNYAIIFPAREVKKMKLINPKHQRR